MNDLESIFAFILQSKGNARRDAVGVYADALEEAGDDRSAWMFRQEDCPLGMDREELLKRGQFEPVMQRIKGGRHGLRTARGDVFDPNPRWEYGYVEIHDFELGVFPLTCSQAAVVVIEGTRRRDYIDLREFPWECVGPAQAAFVCNLLSCEYSFAPYYATEDKGSFSSAVKYPLQPSGKDPYAFRLPTRAEHDYASRAGTTTLFPGWDFPSDCLESHDREEYAKQKMRKYAHFLNLDVWDAGDIPPFPIGQLLPNPWGLYDIYGNVSELCYGTVPEKITIHKQLAYQPHAYKLGGNGMLQVRQLVGDVSSYYSPHVTELPGLRLARTLPPEGKDAHDAGVR